MVLAARQYDNCVCLQDATKEVLLTRDSRRKELNVLWRVDVFVKVVVVTVDQPLQLCGELLPRDRLVYIWRRSLGVILLATIPDHDGSLGMGERSARLIEKQSVVMVLSSLRCRARERREKWGKGKMR